MLRRDFLKVGGFALTALGLYLQKEAIAIPRGAVGAFGLKDAFETKVYTGVTLRMATVATGALITQVSGSPPLSLFKNRMITISDGSKAVTGYIKSVGVTETYELTPTYTSDFSAGVDGWVAAGGTAAGNIDAIGGANDWLRLTVNANNSGHVVYRATPNLVVGALYNLSLDYYIPSTNSVMTSASIESGAANYRYDTASSLATLDAKTTRSINFTAKETGFVRVYGLGGGSFQDAGGDDVLYLRGVVAQRILTPDSTGVVISSTRGGSVQSWATNSGIDPNAASFTVTVSR